MISSQLIKDVDFRAVLLVDAIVLMRGSADYHRARYRKTAWLLIKSTRVLFSIFTKKVSLGHNVLDENALSYLLFLQTYEREDLVREAALMQLSLGPNVYSVFFSRRCWANNYKIALNSVFLAYQLRKKIVRDICRLSQAFTWAEKVFLLSKCVYSICDALVLEPVYSRAKAVCSFQEMVASENIICQVSNKLGLDTYGFIHSMGLGVIGYSPMEGVLSRDTHLDVAMIESSVCKVVFCWGSIHKLIFESFTKARAIIVGKAVVNMSPSELGGFTIVFDSDMKASVKLMHYAHRLVEQGIPISLWFKPATDLANRFGAHRIGPLRKGVLGNKSSLLPQLAVGGSCVFVVGDSFFARFLPLRMVITDFEELMVANSNLDAYCNDAWKNFIACSDTETMSKVTSIILNDAFC